MKRIYQGIVTKMEWVKEDNKPQPFSDDPKEAREQWQKALWEHHELFQDAVNYYLIALLALARESDYKSSAHRLRGRIADSNSEDQVWLPFRRLGVERPGLRNSVAPYSTVTPGNREPTLDQCFAAILAGNENAEKPNVLDCALQELLEECKGENAIQQKGREMFPRFCDPQFRGSFPYDTAAREKRSGGTELPKMLYAPGAANNLKQLSQELRVEWFVNLDKSRQPITGDAMREKLRQALEFVAKSDIQLKAQLDHLKKKIDSLPDSVLSMPAYRGGSINKDSLKLRFFAYLLFRYVETSSITFEALRNAVPQPRTDDSPTEAPAESSCSDLQEDPIHLARGNRGFVFRAFTSLSAWNDRESPEPKWKEFDIAAFKEALKTLHQIRTKEEEREEEKKRLQARLNFMQGNSKKWDEAAEGEPPDLLKGDPRIERLEALLQSELAATYEMAEGQALDYGLRRRTIRGFRDLRKDWRKIVPRGDTLPENSQELKDQLASKLREYQKENPQLIGSVALFEELAKPENWIIWREPDEKKAEDWKNRGFADDPLEALTEERELDQEIEQLNKPVRYTPADPRHSPRQFYFSDVGKLTKRGNYKHEANSRAVIVPLAIRNANGRWEPTRVRISYGAPRLLREHLRVDLGEDLGKAPWQQPMMEAVAPDLPLPQDLTRAAVALMPKQATSGERRFFLNFPLTLNVSLLSERLGKASKWKGQFAKYDSRLSHLLWPEDLPKVQEANRWYQSQKPFTCLGVDLGQRDAAAFALLEVEARSDDPPSGKPRRFIGGTETARWYASLRAIGLLRLPGEDARVWRNKGWSEEFYGERGRSADEGEWQEAQHVCKKLRFDSGAAKDILEDDSRKYSFPELNDRLLFVLDWAQSRLARLQGWSWMLGDDQRRETTLKNIRESDEDPFSLKAVVDKGTNDLLPAIKEQILDYRQRIASALEQVANRVLPLKG
ncbi:MAG: type V CRISPR-associated protein Cas12b, partial [Methylacidiphilaceae bacterium]|nr:type V CRISPR-associated protein Cas12b [Candidatus Methylacidiphilaceae bacterium]